MVKVSISRAMVLPRNAWLNGCSVWISFCGGWLLDRYPERTTVESSVYMCLLLEWNPPKKKLQVLEDDVPAQKG